MQYQVLKGETVRFDIICEGDLSLHPAFCDLHFSCEAVAEFSDAKVLNIVTRSRALPLKTQLDFVRKTG